MRYRALICFAIVCSAISFAFARSPGDSLIAAEASAVVGATGQLFNKSACDFLTAAEASAILGATTQAPKFNGIACMYSVTDTEDLGVSVSDGLGALAESIYDKAIMDKSAKHTAVSGLGEKADFALSDGNHGVLQILSKNRVMVLEARGGKKDGLQDAMIQAAKKILSRL